MAARQSRVMGAGGLALGLLLTMAGCAADATTFGTPTQTTTAAALCTAPLQGSTYALCGHITTATNEPFTTPRAVIGAVDATTRPVTSSGYTIQGGTFHASR